MEKYIITVEPSKGIPVDYSLLSGPKSRATRVISSKHSGRVAVILEGGKSETGMKNINTSLFEIDGFILPILLFLYLTSKSSKNTKREVGDGMSGVRIEGGG